MDRQKHKQKTLLGLSLVYLSKGRAFIKKESILMLAYVCLE